MSEQRAAARYAKSLLDLARSWARCRSEGGHGSVCKTLAESRDLRLLLRNPIVKHDKKLAILRAIFGGKVSEMTDEVFHHPHPAKTAEARWKAWATEFQSAVQRHAVAFRWPK